MKGGRRRTLIFATLVGLWAAFGLVAVPAILRAGDFVLLNEALGAGFSLDFILAQWHQIVVISSVAALALAGFATYLRSPAIVRRVVGEATPGDIGAIRALVCGILLASALWEDVASTADLPRDLLRPMGVMQLLYLLPVGFDHFAASASALSAFKWFTVATLFLGMIGWRTQIVLPIAVVCYLILGGLLRQYAWFYHTGLVPWYLLAIIAMMPSHLGFSVDRVLRERRGKVVEPDVPSIRFGWMRYSIWTGLALPYVMAGLSKLRNGGLDWWDADYFKFILYQGALRPMEFDFKTSLLLTSAPDWLFEMLAISAVAGEIVYGTVLFSRRARQVLPAVMLAMHVGILFLQNILFFDLILLQAVFYNFRPLLRRLRLRLSAPPASDLVGALGTGSPRPTLVLACFLTLFWVFRIEFYPITGMQMFSKKRGEPVVYEIARARLRSGEVIRAPIEDCIGAMADSRYRRILLMAFEPDDERVAGEFMDVCMRRWNASARRSAQMIEIELQLWHWYYLSQPTGPPYGIMMENRIFRPLAETPASAERGR